MLADTFLIEDVESTRSLIWLLLHQGPFRVVGETGTLLGAVQKLSGMVVDLVILDLQMPDGNGIQFLPRLKEIQPNATVVVASAANDAESVQLALEAGAHGYLIKPFTPGALESTLDRAWLRSGKPRLSFKRA